MFILLSKDENTYTVLDTCDGVAEEMQKSQVKDFMRANKGIEIDGLRYFPAENRFTVRSNDLKYECCGKYCVVYDILNKGTLKVKVRLAVYELGTGDEICSETVGNAVSDYISVDVESYVVKGKETCLLEVSYYDKHYYREDRGEDLTCVIILEKQGSGQYIQKENTGFCAELSAYYNKASDSIEMSIGH